MKAEIVLMTGKRIVAQANDGTVVELSANPKTEILNPWARLISKEPHLHIHVETAQGHLVTPGAVLSKTPTRNYFFKLLLLGLVFAVGLLVGHFGGVAYILEALP